LIKLIKGLTNYACKDTFEISIFNKSGKVLKAGSNCAGKGFCDIFSKCRVYDEQNALAKLGKLILNPPTSAEIQTWFEVSIYQLYIYLLIKKFQIEDILVGNFTGVFRLLICPRVNRFLNIQMYRSSASMERGRIEKFEKPEKSKFKKLYS
jgi:hypothetical protein